MKFKLKLKFGKIPPKIALRLLPWFTIVMLFVVLWFTIGFLKIYFYQTLTQAEEISILRSQASLRTINIKLFEQVIAAIENKKSADTDQLRNIPNPFTVKTNTTNAEVSNEAPLPL